MNVLEAALAWHDQGVCVLPVKADGSKAPAVTTWVRYQQEGPTRQQVQDWFTSGHTGIGIVCGAISGNLEMVELEGRAITEGALQELADLIGMAGLENLWERVTVGGYAEQTPSGGIHILYRVQDSPVPGNTKLANRPATDTELAAKPKQKVYGLAETRGEGGYVVVAPSHGTTHPTGLPWTVAYGKPGQVPTITTEEREQLLRLFRCLDAMPLEDPAPARPALQAVPADPNAVSPGDDFEQRTGWEDPDLLGGAGWTVAFTRGHTTFWRRPGKDTPGVSATTGHDPARDRLFVFSSSTEFTTENPYTKFAAYAVLHHGGDYRAAARDLRRRGYGTPTPNPFEKAERAAINELVPARPATVDGTAVRHIEPASQPGTRNELPSPHQPLAVARELVTRQTTPRTWWLGDFYEWQGTHWNPVEGTVIDNWIYQQTEHARYLHIDPKGNEEWRPWSPSKRRVADVAHALGVGALHRTGEPAQVVATTNGVLEDVATRELAAHSPDRFNLFSLPFAYDKNATCPQWLAFLESVLPGDTEAHEFLAEWFGYVLSGRTDLQKMAALIGPRRCGKGTIARVLTAMLGAVNVSGLDLNLLSGTFGLQNLIGKSLAISGDVRWHSRSIADAVPILLQVIGEDLREVPRKNRPSWNGQLGTRFMLMSNDTPTFSDRSGALSGRMIYIKFELSFFGREDSALTGKLMTELPGILNWALDGLDRLAERGRFTEPASGQAEADVVRRLSDPIGAFLEDWCVLDKDKSISLDVLYQRYKSWCSDEGRIKDTTTKEIFSRDLRAKVPNMVVKRERVLGKQERTIYGVGCDVGPGLGF